MVQKFIHCKGRVHSLSIAIIFSCLLQVEEDGVPGIVLRLYEAYGTHVSVNVTVSPLLEVKHYQRCLLFNELVVFKCVQCLMHPPSLSLFLSLSLAVRVNLLEEPIEEKQFYRGSLSAYFTPFQIQTFVLLTS